MADNTTNYALPYPTTRDGVVVHADIERLAQRVDSALHPAINQARDAAIQDATTKYGDLPQRVGGLEVDMLPRDEAEQYGIEGPEGPEGPAGPRGLPGVNAVDNDEAVATYINALDSQTRQALEALTFGRGQTYVQDTPPVEPNADDVWITPDDGVWHTYDTGQWVAHDRLHADQDERITGQWVFLHPMAVEREFSTTNGDLFDSTTRIEMAVRDQQGTAQNPPGYSMATVSLIEDGDNAPHYQGESARMALISNRILFNRRVEVDMGGSGRAVLRSGTTPGSQLAEIGLHNASYPRFTVYGDQNESHGGNRKNMGVLDGGGLLVYRANELAQQWHRTNAQDVELAANMTLSDTGHVELSADYNGDKVGAVRFEPTDMSLELRAAGGVVLNDQTLARQDLTFDPNRGPVIQSSNGRTHRIVVDNDGTLTTEEVS